MRDTHHDPVVRVAPQSGYRSPTLEALHKLQIAAASYGITIHFESASPGQARGVMPRIDGKQYIVQVQELPPGEGGGLSRLVPADSAAALALSQQSTESAGLELGTAGQSAHAAAAILAQPDLSPVMTRLASAQIDIAYSRLISAKRRIDDAIENARVAIEMERVANG